LLKHLLKVRYLAAVVSLLAILHAIAFLFMGTRVALNAYGHILRGETGGAPGERPGLELLHSLDFLLFGLVLIILRGTSVNGRASRSTGRRGDGKAGGGQARWLRRHRIVCHRCPDWRPGRGDDHQVMD
jgi:hypothetical protein